MESITIRTLPKSGMNGYKILCIHSSDGIDKNTDVFNIVILLCRLREVYGHNDNNRFAYTFGLNIGG